MWVYTHICPYICPYTYVHIVTCVYIYKCIKCVISLQMSLVINFCQRNLILYNSFFLWSVL